MDVLEQQITAAPTLSPARFEGVLLGTAVGDALGLPAENLSPRAIRRRWNGEWRMRFLPGRGMISDDTEHTLLVAQALISSPDDAEAFQRTLARKFRWWFASLPGGMGLATARACLKLWLGVPPAKAAVRSGGSGPAMRSAIIGTFFADNPKRRREFTLASSRLTHIGWQAEVGALAVAEAAALAVTHKGTPDASIVLPALAELANEREWTERISQIKSALEQNRSVDEFSQVMGLEKGVSGYSLHVVPVALFAWLRHAGDFRCAMVAAMECGGDTDTVGAIVGALCGASNGTDGIPPQWLHGLAEWPRSTGFMRAVAQRLMERSVINKPLEEVHYCWPGLIPRNFFFLAVVLLHGFRRLFPPY